MLGGDVPGMVGNWGELSIRVDKKMLSTICYEFMTYDNDLQNNDLLLSVLPTNFLSSLRPYLFVN